MTSSHAVDDYLAGLPPDRRAYMQQLRETIRSVAPDADEAISYKMPAFRANGRFFISYDAYKRHYSLFGSTDSAIEACGDAIRPYVTGKGTISFPIDEPLPVELVRTIVSVRLTEIRARPPR